MCSIVIDAVLELLYSIDKKKTHCRGCSQMIIINLLNSLKINHPLQFLLIQF